IEAARLDVDTALKIETRGLTYLLGTPQAKNLITTFFFQMNQLNAGGSRPKALPKHSVQKVGVLGAGMMGQGIAYVSALAGIQVVLKDVSLESAAKGKGHSEKLLSKRVEKGAMDAARMQAVLDLIQPTAADADLDGCDLIIETVFENFALKRQVTAQTERFLAAGGIYASNTSSLPISQLAEAARQPEHYIGIHFFSPVDRMPLVEIICGKHTTDATLAKAYDFAVQIKKTPIVVNDSLGFFTSRTFATYLDEGVRLLREGVHPVLIDAMGKAIGMPLGPLAVHDEVSLELNRKIAATWNELGVLDKFGEQKVFREVINTMITEFGRGGRHHGGGFYEYAADGSKRVWPRLLQLYHRSDVHIEQQDLKDRLLFRQVIEALRCLQEGVLRTVADGNIGSIMGIGAPTWTGGFIQFVNTYGAQRFVDRCRVLADRYGERFAPPTIAIEKAARGELFA
ncbi:MAG: 3-hydroxyacyl-CoA dehydrogenase NAD-binding domain-containing protein, partial [Steroidobacteraceae bacterium]